MTEQERKKKRESERKEGRKEGKEKKRERKKEKERKRKRERRPEFREPGFTFLSDPVALTPSSSPATQVEHLLSQAYLEDPRCVGTG